jgi:hypothetical protein
MTHETQKHIEKMARPNILWKASSDAPVKRSRHAFERLDGISRKGEGPQLLAFAIALLIWFVLCGLLHLAMHLSKNA